MVVPRGGEREADINEPLKNGPLKVYGFLEARSVLLARDVSPAAGDVAVIGTIKVGLALHSRAVPTRKIKVENFEGLLEAVINSKRYIIENFAYRAFSTGQALRPVKHQGLISDDRLRQVSTVTVH